MRLVFAVAVLTALAVAFPLLRERGPGDRNGTGPAGAATPAVRTSDVSRVSFPARRCGNPPRTPARSLPVRAAASAPATGAARFRPVKPGIVTVRPRTPDDLAAIERLVVAGGGRVFGRCGIKSAPSLRVEVDAATLARLMERGEVAWLENPARRVLHNDVAAAVLGVTNVWPAAGLPGLTGRGQFITTSDTGIDTGDMTTIHRDFTNALVGFATVTYVDSTGQKTTLAQDVNGHGTHTAGSLVGDGTLSDGLIRGTAFGAKLWAWFCGGEDDGIYLPAYYDDLFRPDGLTNGTACIHSASWGTEKVFSYNETSREIDAYCWQHPDFLPVFSAGNSGKSDSCKVGPEALAKNVLAVGATETDRGRNINGFSCRYPDKITTYSSCGPSPDGRVKPDVVAPGSGICSARSTQASDSLEVYGDHYWYMQGTSMACPLTAGCAALVREWLVDRRGFAAPSAALVKAVLMGGADELFGKTVTNVTAPAPNGREGWGRVNVGASVAPDAGRAVYLADYLPFHAGSNVTFTVTTTNAAPLDVQLVWIDYPGTLYADETTPVLVNDLNLSVKAADETVSLGNGGSEPDCLNNAESVRIASAAAGVYEVAVSAFAIGHSSDEGGAAALYIRGAFDPAAVNVTTTETAKVTLKVTSSSPGDCLASPAIGEYAYLPGTEVTLLADTYSVVTGRHGTFSARYPFVGFSGSGNVPAHGSTNVVTLTITEDSAIDWQWDAAHPDYRYRTYLRLYGYAESVFKMQGNLYLDYDRYNKSPYKLADKWVATNEQFKVKLPGDIAYDPFARTGYHSTDNWQTYSYGNWTYRFAQAFYARTDENLQYLYSNATGRPWSEVTITMDEGCDLVLDYYEADDVITGLNIRTWAPTWWILKNIWWLDGYGIDGSADADPDGDGFTSQEEYKVDTLPLDATSRLQLTEVTATNIAWQGGDEVPQVLERSETLANPDWVPVATNSAGACGSWSRAGETATNGFYRISVPQGLQR